MPEERGVALPMALLSLALLTSLMLALASISQTEPLIAVNHLRASQARALAESGVEYALWALSSPGAAGGLPASWPEGPAPSPFDGRTFLTMGAVGGFTVEVHAAGDPFRRAVTAVGWAPDDLTADGRPRARRRIVAEAAVVPDLGPRAPCALCVRGALHVAGDVVIDGASADPACGGDVRHGTFTRDALTTSGPVRIAGGAGASAQHRPAADFDAVTLTGGALDALKALARRSGTYYGPGFPGGGRSPDGGSSWEGRLTFDAARPLPDGVVFVDTVDGRNLEATSGGATAAEVRLEAGAISPEGVRGWLVVNGSLQVTGGGRLHGLVYALEGLAYRPGAAASLEGLAVALNTSGAAHALVEPTGSGSATLTFDCLHARGAGRVPHRFMPLPGTYHEAPD